MQQVITVQSPQRRHETNVKLIYYVFTRQASPNDGRLTGCNVPVRCLRGLTAATFKRDSPFFWTDNADNVPRYMQNVLMKPHTFRQPKRGCRNLTFPSSKQNSDHIFWDSSFKLQSQDGQLRDSSLVFLRSCRQSKITRPPGDGKRVILWTLLISQSVNKFPAFYENRWFISVVTKAHHLSIMWGR